MKIRQIIKANFLADDNTIVSGAIIIKVGSNGKKIKISAT